MSDPTERQREYQRQYAADNADRKREAARLWRQQNPERSRQSRRDYVLAHREEILEYDRRRYRRRRYRRPGRHGKSPRERLRDEVILRLWAEQAERCYLCEEPVALADCVLEHDHRCCPRTRFCRFCVRGASCQPCNSAIGFAFDDPDLLERIARNLRAKLTEVDERLASKPEQLTMD